MKYTSLDRTAVKGIQAEFAETMKRFAEERGLKVRGGTKAGYTDNSIRFTVEVELAELADGRSVAQADWEQYCGIFGLTKTDFGKSFRNGSQGVFTVVGLNMKARSNPIICRGEDGRNYTFKEDAVLRRLREHAVTVPA